MLRLQQCVGSKMEPGGGNHSLIETI